MSVLSAFCGVTSSKSFDAESSEFDRFIVFTREPGFREDRFDFIPAPPFYALTRERFEEPLVGVETAAHEGDRSRPELRARWWRTMLDNQYGGFDRAGDLIEFFAFCESR